MFPQSATLSRAPRRAGGRPVVRAGLGLALALGLSACAAIYDNHGYVPPEEDLALITPGQDTRASVEEAIGRPLANGVFRDEAWLWVASRVRNYAYRAPETVERRIVAISFDEAGTVTNVERFGLQDGQAVPLSRRVTETTISDTTLFQQLLRNIGQVDLGNALGDG